MAPQIAVSQTLKNAVESIELHAGRILRSRKTPIPICTFTDHPLELFLDEVCLSPVYSRRPPPAELPCASTPSPFLPKLLLWGE